MITIKSERELALMREAGRIVAQVLAEYLGLVDAPSQGHPGPEQLALDFGDLCPECGNAALINEEGCRHCYSCGYSEC